MPLREGDLKNTVLKKISIDEYEPKTGESNEVMVIGFFVIQDAPGEDLYLFINNSAVDIRDVEVSPNPNSDNYYMVFIEIDRNEQAIETIAELIKDVERVAGHLEWEVRSNLIDEYVPIKDIRGFVQLDPQNYLSRKEWMEQHRAQEEAANVPSIEENIYSFLKDTNLLEANIDDKHLEMSGADGRVSLQIVEFGNAQQIKDLLGINESAIKQDFDVPYYNKLNSMLGELNAIPINEYVVIFNESTEQVLVAKQY